MADEKKSKGSFFSIITFFLALSAFIMSSVSLLIIRDNGELLKNASIKIIKLKKNMNAGKNHNKESLEKVKNIDKIKKELNEIRTRFMESDDYNTAKEKLEDLKYDLQQYNKKWGTSSKLVFNDLKKKLSETIESLKKKTSNSAAQIDNFSRQLDKFVKKEKNEESTENIENE
jgi:hypothetical protein